MRPCRIHGIEDRFDYGQFRYLAQKKREPVLDIRNQHGRGYLDHSGKTREGQVTCVWERQRQKGNISAGKGKS